MSVRWCRASVWPAWILDSILALKAICSVIPDGRSSSCGRSFGSEIRLDCIFWIPAQLLVSDEQREKKKKNHTLGSAARWSLEGEFRCSREIKTWTLSLKSRPYPWSQHWGGSNLSNPLPQKHLENSTCSKKYLLIHGDVLPTSTSKTSEAIRTPEPLIHAKCYNTHEPQQLLAWKRGLEVHSVLWAEVTDYNL